VSSAYPTPDVSLVDLEETGELPVLGNTQERRTPDPKRIHPRAKAHGVSPATIKVGDALRLAFLACYVVSATASQIAAATLIVYLINF
jgi:hypothetical protein